MLRKQPPADCVIEAAIAMEEQTAGFDGDNVDCVRPWSSMVARLQDAEPVSLPDARVPDAIVSLPMQRQAVTEGCYRQMNVDVRTPYRIKLPSRGNEFRAWCDGELLFRATDYDCESG